MTTWWHAAWARVQLGKSVMNVRDRTGERYGRLVALRPVGKAPTGRLIWEFLCDCGSTVQRSDIPRSCGCLAREGTSRRSKTHGRSRVDDPTYKVWVQMRRRCRERDDYGGRGVRVCARWERYENFLADMGPKPTGKQIDRINNDQGYSPDNCRWASPKENSNNRRNSILIAHDGLTLSAAEWSERLGIPAPTIRYRYHQGWSADRILSVR